MHFNVTSLHDTYFTCRNFWFSTLYSFDSSSAMYTLQPTLRRYTCLVRVIPCAVSLALGLRTCGVAIQCWLCNKASGANLRVFPSHSLEGRRPRGVGITAWSTLMARLGAMKYVYAWLGSICGQILWTRCFLMICRHCCHVGGSERFLLALSFDTLNHFKSQSIVRSRTTKYSL